MTMTWSTERTEANLEAWVGSNVDVVKVAPDTAKETSVVVGREEETVWDEEGEEAQLLRHNFTTNNTSKAERTPKLGIE